MRERHFFVLLFYVGLGITPAYAGKTYEGKVYAIYRRDHPRVCGKDRDDVKPFDLALGSPPRMRERQFYHRA